ncbi:hypothetical protein BT96DRAFT_998147 [Gymnopus androsaceus JB14]|uniref:Uncharacterized protein n=1 Tax=Gymnopus androsaceus JB14 TaxID=1447944 RepID=A0A6A4HC11_9AGAR|nr:hypothetical protein BT96DRAFT_998147 [Gymnopus androsaceus JB14]
MDSLDGYGSGDDENMEDAVFHREISSLVDRCSTFVSNSGIDETHTSSSHNGMSNLILNSNASLPGPTSNAPLLSPTSNSPLSGPSASSRSMSAPIDSPIESSFIFYNTPTSEAASPRPHSRSTTPGRNYNTWECDLCHSVINIDIE